MLLNYIINSAKYAMDDSVLSNSFIVLAEMREKVESHFLIVSLNLTP
jgi:hypothetical protein